MSRVEKPDLGLVPSAGKLVLSVGEHATTCSKCQKMWNRCQERGNVYKECTCISHINFVFGFVSDCLKYNKMHWICSDLLNNSVLQLLPELFQSFEDIDWLNWCTFFKTRFLLVAARLIGVNSSFVIHSSLLSLMTGLTYFVLLADNKMSENKETESNTDYHLLVCCAIEASVVYT